MYKINSKIFFLEEVLFLGGSS